MIQSRRLISNPRHLFLLAGVIALALTAPAAEKAPPAFGDVVELAPFVVNGKALSISIHARTKSDRRYAEKFADEVVEIAYQTLGDTTGKGLVIVGAKGEPHPIHVFRKFLAMAAAGQLDPTVAAKAGELAGIVEDWKKKLHLDEETARERAKEKDGEKVVNLSFDMIVPALPLPLEKVGSKLYQLAWAENFDDARIEKKLQALTAADLESDALSKYDWVFYLPPRDAFEPVMKALMADAMEQAKLGLVKRAAMRSALLVFKPMIKKAIEAMRKGVLFMTVLRAESSYSDEDIMALSNAYMKVLMPDFKFNGGTERQRALEAIEQQKLANIEYAKDPFVKPERLATYDPAAYAAFEGEYTVKPPQVTHRFRREGDTFLWSYKSAKPRVFYPAGDRLFVNESGTMTIRFLVDETGAVTGVEERWVRRRHTIARKAEVSGKS